MSEMTRQEAEHLSFYIHLIRPDWEREGIIAALGRCVRMADSGALAIAAIRAASTPTNRTPAVIGMAGPHWGEPRPTPQVRSPRPAASGGTCSVCGLDPAACRSRWTGDHEFESINDARNRARRRTDA